MVFIRQLDDRQPIYLQIKQFLEDAILNGDIQASERIPSTNELAEFYQINPATARQGVNELAEEGIVTKRRGVGMFVSEEGRQIILQKRKQQFHDHFIIPLKKEAEKLGITETELIQLMTKGGRKNEN